MIKCNSCDSDNLDEALFCDQCGSGLVLICKKCNETCPPGSKFCTGCGLSFTSENSQDNKEVTRKKNLNKSEPLRSTRDSENSLVAKSTLSSGRKQEKPNPSATKKISDTLKDELIKKHKNKILRARVIMAILIATIASLIYLSKH